MCTACGCTWPKPGRRTRRSSCCEDDHDYLLEGGVFTPDLIETWIAYKRENEIDPLRLRPHPYEFALYYDVWSVAPPDVKARCSCPGTGRPPSSCTGGSVVV
jgi:hypothetical protein